MLLKKVLSSIAIAVSLASCTPAITQTSLNPTYVDSVVAIHIDPKINKKYHDLIIKSIKNAAPAFLDVVKVTQITGMRTAGSNSGSNYSEIFLSDNLEKFSPEEIIFQIGHELGHADPDVKALDNYEKEYTCDQWGILTVLELGYDGYKAAAFFKKFDFPASFSHPCSASRYEKVIATVKMRGNK